MKPIYTGYKSILRDGRLHFAEVAVRASPGPAPSRVTLSTDALESLRAVFGEDFEYQRHNVWAAVQVQIDTANVKGAVPRVGATSFHAEVVGVRLSGNAGREVSGFLLSVAGMDAIAEYLWAWEVFHDERGHAARPDG